MGRLLSTTNALLFTATLTYAIVSKSIFDRIYITSKQVIDEEFHIPQGLAYCNLHFDTWDPKITTLPGLYLVSALFLAPFNLCLIYWLRFINLAASALNLLLFYNLLRLYNKNEVAWKAIFSSVNISLLPPLYFFNHLYYTDTISLTLVLFTLIFERKNNHFAASIAGMSSVLMRQTNIIWVAMLFGKYFVTHGVNNTLKKRQQQKKKDHLRISQKDLLQLTKTKTITIPNFSLHEWLDISSYLTTLVSFAFFVYFNGSIVVGDKNAHVATLHLPQIFYFSLFTAVFMWPFFLPKVLAFFRTAIRWKFTVALILTIFAIIVHQNTMIHPYLLADNRHYTFYIWQRIYGRYFFAKYALISCYVFALYCIWSIIYNSQDISLALAYIPAVLLVLMSQKLIEVRYFFIPYVLLRLNVKNVSLKQLICEFLSFVVINYFTLNVFFTKNIFWVNYTQPQKLIW